VTNLPSLESPTGSSFSGFKTSTGNQNKQASFGSGIRFKGIGSMSWIGKHLTCMNSTYVQEIEQWSERLDFSLEFDLVFIIVDRKRGVFEFPLFVDRIRSFSVTCRKFALSVGCSYDSCGSWVCFEICLLIPCSRSPSAPLLPWAPTFELLFMPPSAYSCLSRLGLSFSFG